MQIVTKLPTAGLHRLLRDGTLSAEATKRLKWMNYLHQGNTVAQTQRHFDIPESTIRFWQKRYNPYRLTSLEDKSHRPIHVRFSSVVLRVAECIVSLRKKHHYGKTKLQKLLADQGIFVGQSRIQKIVNQAGLKRLRKLRKTGKRKNRSHMYSVPRQNLQCPGGLIYLDVKHLILAGGGKAYQFTAIDHATRMLFVRAYSQITSTSTVAFLAYLQKQVPFTQILFIGSDNGSEFLGVFEQALEKQHIPHVFSSPRSPKQNPFVERVIRTMIEEYYWQNGVAASIEELNLKIERYAEEYNTVRPHHSLGLKTPMNYFTMLQSLNYSTAIPQHHPN